MTRAEILWQSVKSYKIPGQSRKVNDLFCYPTSSPTVKKGWILVIPPAPTQSLSFKIKNVADLFARFIAVFAFPERRSAKRDAAARLNRLQTGIFRWSSRRLCACLP